MTKIAIFGGTDVAALQNSVNAFIADKKVVDIKFQTFLCNIGSNATAAADRILVIYEEDAE